MSFFCGPHVSKWVILLGLCEFAVNYLALVQSEGIAQVCLKLADLVPKSDDMQKFLKIQQRDADFRSILPSYVLKNGSACVDLLVCVWNPLHFHKKETRKTKTSRFSPPSPPRCHFLNRYLSTPN